MTPSSAIPCKFFAMGICHNGERCAFSHHITTPELHIQQVGQYKYVQNAKSNIRHDGDGRIIGHRSEAEPAHPYMYEDVGSAYGVNSGYGGYQRAASPPSFFSDRSRYKWVAPNLRKQSHNEETQGRVITPPFADTSQVTSSPFDSFASSSSSSQRVLLPEKTGSVGGQQSHDWNLEGTPIFRNYYYSDVASLSESDLMQFEADSFDVTKIPEVPPPKHLC